MTRENYMEWLFAVVFTIIGVCASVFFLRLTYELLTMPRILTRTETVELTQKQKDDVCVQWWFDSDLAAAKKRVCGK
jgi:hypothetical protein